MSNEKVEILADDLRALLGVIEATGTMVPRVEDPLELWRGEFGDEYVERCAYDPHHVEALIEQWSEILEHTPEVYSILEIGANIGLNLHALYEITDAHLVAVEPNDKARAKLPQWVETYAGTAQEIPLPDGSADLVFTSGVLIHIRPDDLLKVCSEIHRVSRRYIVAVEYWANTPQELVYRGHGGALFKRDWGSFYLDNFPDLHPVASGFSWRRLTGLDDVTYQVLEKR